MEKINNEKVYKLFENKGYKIIGEYKNSTTPVVCEKDGYRYKTTYHSLNSGKKPSFWGFNNLDNLEFNINSMLKKRESSTTFLGYEVVIKGKQKRILLHFQCSCGQKFDKILEDAVYGKHLVCRDCQIAIRGKNSRLGRKVVDFLKSKGYKVFDESKIYKNNEYVEVEDCQGFRGFVTYNHVLHRNDSMSKFDVRVNKKHYVFNVNHYAELQGIDVCCLGLVDEKLHNRQSLRFQCSCGKEFTTSIASFQNGKVRCEECTKSISRYEYIFQQYLRELNIENIYQYSYNQCRDILPLPFDFFIKKYNCLVEIDGEGHFYPCNFNRISDERAMQTFLVTQNHDKIKTTFCEENHIPLLRITYKDFADKTYKKKFQNFIEEVANLG